MGDIPMSRINRILDAVNRRYPKEAINLRNEEEEMYYDRFWAEAEELAAKYGDWPVFEMGEIDYDDPLLDIY